MEGLALVIIVSLLVAGVVIAIRSAKRQEEEARAHGEHVSDEGVSESQTILQAQPPPAKPTESAPPARPEPPSPQRVFLSYRREDSADVAGRIYDRLTQSLDKTQVFKDVDSIPLGVDFRKHLQQTVEGCDVMLAVVGDRWLGAGGAHRRIDDAKDFVRIELETALQRDIPVIPLLVRGAQVPSETELPPTLASFAYRNGISVRPDPDFHRDMDRLIQHLKTHLAQKVAGT